MIHIYAKEFPIFFFLRHWHHKSKGLNINSKVWCDNYIRLGRDTINILMSLLIRRALSCIRVASIYNARLRRAYSRTASHSVSFIAYWLCMCSMYVCKYIFKDFFSMVSQLKYKVLF